MELNTLQFDFADSLWQFLYTMLLISCISFFLYLRRGGKPEFVLVFLVVAAIVFQFCHLLKTMTISLSLAFGLFALFSLMRFRSRPIALRDLTYLFVSIGIAVLDGLIVNEPFYEIMIWDFLIVGILICGEIIQSKYKHTHKLVVYEKMDLLQEDNQELLMADLCSRLSIKKINKVKIGKVDFKKNTAELMVYFKDENNSNFT